MRRGSPVSDNEKIKKRIESMKNEMSLQAERLIQNNGESTEDNVDDRKFKSESVRQDLGIIFREKIIWFK